MSPFSDFAALCNLRLAAILRNWTISPSLAFFPFVLPTEEEDLDSKDSSMTSKLQGKVRQKKRKGDGAGAAQEEEGATQQVRLSGSPRKVEFRQEGGSGHLYHGWDQDKNGSALFSKER